MRVARGDAFDRRCGAGFGNTRAKHIQIPAVGVEFTNGDQPGDHLTKVSQCDRWKALPVPPG